MKKIISFFCVFAMLFSAVSLCAYAEEEATFKPYDDSLFFTYGDYDIHYRVIPAQGEQKGRIMMLHGFLCSTFAWRNMAAELSAQGYECVLADLPNFGYSTRENDEMTIVDREILITELMKSIAPMEEWIIAGHSMGGGVSINMAIENDVQALLLYMPAPQSEFPDAMEGFMTSKPMKGIMNAFFKYGTKFSPLVRMIIYMATMDWEFTKDYDLSGVTDATQYNGFGGGMCEMMFNVKATQLDRTGEITCPVLVCQASKDMIINQTMKDQISAALPDATYYTVEGGGHQCIENRAEELCGVTVDFLNK